MLPCFTAVSVLAISRAPSISGAVCVSAGFRGRQQASHSSPRWLGSLSFSPGERRWAPSAPRSAVEARRHIAPSSHRVEVAPCLAPRHAARPVNVAATVQVSRCRCGGRCRPCVSFCTHACNCSSGCAYKALVLLSGRHGSEVRRSYLLRARQKFARPVPTPPNLRPGRARVESASAMPPSTWDIYTRIDDHMRASENRILSAVSR